MMASERIIWPFPGCAYCGGRVIFGEYLTELAMKCEDCPCRMVVPNKRGQKERLFMAWKMRIGNPPKIRVRKPSPVPLPSQEATDPDPAVTGKGKGAEG